MSPHKPLPWLGQISANVFMRDYWQKRPLFVKGAFRGSFQKELPLSEAAFRALCGHPELPVRLVRGAGETLVNGPLRASQVPRPRSRDWAILIQQVNTAVPSARDFLAHFRFLPDARLEDLMVSLAGPQGGIGPHVDTYDVFLVQAAGTRDWSIAEQFDPTLVEDIPLRVLQRYQPEQVFQCEPGDLLYLPPNIAHHGVATSAGCMTYSVGFRAPDPVEIADEAVGLRLDDIGELGWSDPWLTPAARPWEVPEAMMNAMVQAARRCLPGDEDLARSALVTLSRLHPGAQWPAPGQLSLRAFRARLQRGPRRGLALHPGARVIQYRGQLAVNGEIIDLSALKASERRILLKSVARLTTDRSLIEEASSWAKRSEAFCQALYQLYEIGAVQLL